MQTKIQQVDKDVRAAATRLARALVDSDAEIIVGLVRRLPRILDILVDDPDLKANLNEKLVYSSGIDLNPSLVKGRKVALVDNCVQRGMNLRCYYESLQKKAARLRVFAFARSLWHVEHGQYTGLHIEEPLLELEPDDFELVTSYVNWALSDSPVPLDCEDTILELELLQDVAPQEFLAGLAQIAPLQLIPRSPHSGIHLCSQYVGSDHPLASGLLKQLAAVHLAIEEEVKLAWTMEEGGKIYFVPIVLYSATGQVSSDIAVPAGAPNDLFNFRRLFPHAEDDTLAWFEAVQLWASALIAGRIWKSLEALNVHCRPKPIIEEFQRADGAETGEAAHKLYLEIIQQEFNGFSAQLAAPPGVPIEIEKDRFHELGSSIRRILGKYYITTNESRQRLEWVPVGLSFPELRQALAMSDCPAQPGEISARLDELLATCWLKSGTDKSDGIIHTKYFCTEQNPQRSADVNHLSFSRPRDYLRRQISRGLVAAFAAVLPRAEDSSLPPGGIIDGHFRHGLVVALDLLGDDKKYTLLLRSPQPRGHIVWCDTTHHEVRGNGSIEANQELLGIRVVQIPNRGNIIIPTLDATLLHQTPIEQKVLLLTREFADALRQVGTTQLSVGDVLTFLSSCKDAQRAFETLGQNLRGTRDALEALFAGTTRSKPHLDDSEQHISGAFDKLRVIRYAEAISKWLRAEQSGPGRSLDFLKYVETIDRNIAANGWTGIFSQLVAEAQFLRKSVVTGILNQGDLFGETKDAPAETAREIYKEWEEVIAKLGFVSESGHKLPFPRLSSPRAKRTGPAELAFVKLDRSRHGAAESDSESDERQHKHFPLFRSFAGFYNGEELKAPEGDALLFGFARPTDGVRFAHAVAAAVSVYDAVPRFYRVTLTYGPAAFESDGNIRSSALDIERDVADGLKTKERDVTRKGVVVGSLMNSILWKCVTSDLQRYGAEVGELNYTGGKRPLPEPIRYIAINTLATEPQDIKS